MLPVSVSFCCVANPGVYNEQIFESLDFVLDEASKRNLSLIIPIEVRRSDPSPPLALSSMVQLVGYGMGRAWAGYVCQAAGFGKACNLS